MTIILLLYAIYCDIGFYYICMFLLKLKSIKLTTWSKSMWGSNILCVSGQKKMHAKVYQSSLEKADLKAVGSLSWIVHLMFCCFWWLPDLFTILHLQKQFYLRYQGKTNKEKTATLKHASQQNSKMHYSVCKCSFFCIQCIIIKEKIHNQIEISYM